MLLNDFSTFKKLLKNTKKLDENAATRDYNSLYYNSSENEVERLYNSSPIIQESSTTYYEETEIHQTNEWNKEFLDPPTDDKISEVTFFIE
jgi:transketolase